jgi:hypothetical protein
MSWLNTLNADIKGREFIGGYLLQIESLTVELRDIGNARLGLRDNPQGPPPGPELPKKRRPKIF